MASYERIFTLRSTILLVFGVLLLLVVVSGSEKSPKRNRHHTPTTTITNTPYVVFSPPARHKTRTTTSGTFVTHGRHFHKHHRSTTAEPDSVFVVATKGYQRNSWSGGKGNKTLLAETNKLGGILTSTSTSKPVIAVSTTRRNVPTKPSVVVTDDPDSKYRPSFTFKPHALQSTTTTSTFLRSRNNVSTIVPGTSTTSKGLSRDLNHNAGGFRKTTTTYPTTRAKSIVVKMTTTSPQLSYYAAPRTTTSLDGSDDDDLCEEPCDMRHCDAVPAESCHGKVVRDKCGCCPVCDDEVDESYGDSPSSQTALATSNACENMSCPRNKVCILNIQGLPMCRCRNVYLCKGVEKKPICTSDGVTFKNHCFLKIEECIQNRRLRIAHKGACRMTGDSSRPVVFTSTTSRPPSTNIPDYTVSVTARKKARNHAKKDIVDGMFVREKRKGRKNMNL